MATHYEALGVAHRAPLAEIQRAHRQLAAQYHPDLHPGDAAAQEQFKAIQRAYDVLSDEARRQAYDEHLQRQLEAKAGRWLSRTLRSWHTSARRHHRHRPRSTWRPLHGAAWAVAACVLVGSTFAVLNRLESNRRHPQPDPSLVATDDAGLGITPGGIVADQPPAAEGALVPPPVVPGAVEVSNPSPRDVYRPPLRP